MNVNRDELNRKIHALYRAEHAALGQGGTLELLERGRQWDLAKALADGGVVVFPHAGVADCGHHVAAAVHACLDSGAQRVLIISVLHAWDEAMEAARVRVAQGGADLNIEPLRGIQGPGLSGRQDWKKDHALYSFRHFWKAETRRRGVKGPEIIERYPFLAGGHPETLPGIEELDALAKDAVIVSTADPFHHGIGYGDAPEATHAPDAAGLAHARGVIEAGIALLERGDHWGYNQHCVKAKSDARDAGQMFRHVRGPLKGRVLDLAYTDTAEFYGAPPPTWVAAPLIVWERA